MTYRVRSIRLQEAFGPDEEREVEDVPAIGRAACPHCDKVFDAFVPGLAPRKYCSKRCTKNASQRRMYARKGGLNPKRRYKKHD